MRKIFTFFFAAMIAMTASADLWLEENFNYPDGPLEQADNSQLVVGKWMQSLKPADSLGVSPQVVDRNLTLAGYPGSGKGKSAVLDANVGASSGSQRISVYYLDTLGARDTVSMYAAFLFKPISAQNNSGRDFVIWEGSVASSMCRGRVFLAKNGTAVKIGVTKNSSTISAWSGDIEVGSTNLIVMKYEVVEGASNDVVKVFVNPTLNTAESANTALVTTDNATDMLVKGFGLRQRGTGAEISGLRIGTSWEDVMGMELDALLLESSEPANNSYVDPETTSLTLTFNKEVERGNGTITLTEIGGESLPLAPAIEGKVVTLPVSLLAEKEYRLSLSAGAFINGTTQNVAIELDFNTKNPDVYAVEEFRYESGAALEGQGGWVVSTATADQGGKSPLVGDTTLTYAGHGVTEGGLSMVLDSVQQEISGELKRNTVWPFSADAISKEDGSNVVYTAFMINLSEMNSTSGKDIFTYLKQGAEAGTNTTMRGRVQVKIEKDKMVFGIRKNSETITQWSDSIEKAETALLVIKYVNKSTSSSGDADEFYMYVNPDLSKTEAENNAKLQVADGNEDGGGADLRYICFRQMKLNAIVSGIRVAKTWEAALNYVEVSDGPAQGIEDVQGKKVQCTKVLKDGQLYIVRDGAVYTVNGLRIK